MFCHESVLFEVFPNVIEKDAVQGPELPGMYGLYWLGFDHGDSNDLLKEQKMTTWS
jgi:hypothetical protein